LLITGVEAVCGSDVVLVFEGSNRLKNLVKPDGFDTGGEGLAAGGCGCDIHKISKWVGNRNNIN
jgi:hypothetical protein